MKKQFTNTLNLLIIAVILLAVSGCKILSGSGGKTDSGNTSQSNYTTSDKTKTGGLADEIIGTWEIVDGDKTRFTFGKGGSLVVKNDESPAQNANYSVIGDDAIEVKADGKPKMVIIIKISGDKMRMNTQNRGNDTLKRIN